MWAPKGEAARVLLSGRNARQVVFDCMNLMTGHRIFLVREHQRATDFQAFLREVRRGYRGWHVAMLLDGDSSHTATASPDLADQLEIKLIWLPERAPELNPMDTLWGQGKDAISVNKQYATLDEQVGSFVAHLDGLSNKEALQTSGIMSENFWLRMVLSKNFS